MKIEQKPDRFDRSPIICPKCKNAVYVPNLTTYSCPCCSIEVIEEKKIEKPMSVKRAMFTIGMTGCRK